MTDLGNLLKETCPLVDFDKNNLLSGKVIDSMDIVNIIAAIENKYGIDVEFEMITSDNFDSVDAIYEMINKLKQK